MLRESMNKLWLQIQTFPTIKWPKHSFFKLTDSEKSAATIQGLKILIKQSSFKSQEGTENERQILLLPYQRDTTEHTQISGL